MPRNRRLRDRDEKRAEIVAAARQLFVERGFDAVPISRVATDAGVTANTIYWYFADKDELLVAVLEAVLADSLQRYAELAEPDLTGRVLWIVSELRSLRTLVDTVHSRRLTSEAVDNWHNGFHAVADEMTRASLPADLPTDQLDATCHIVTFVIEGILTHPADAATTRTIVETLVRSIIAGGQG
ncbi:TetR/AcrR family transcriptional regulator [Gordonia sp. NPDC058843]|uniref:TetR/AcrR family transcriptional regulator n=1 Tax=Gordonia sp. NPDC058843 TaxID=3346648 RepID=UPI0036997D5B